MKFQSTGEEQTRWVGRALGEVVTSGTVIGLVGDLGAGKTRFVQGLAQGCGVPAEMSVVSPTFTLINEYSGGRVDVFHADLYRLERELELDEIGLYDIVRGDAVVAVEWAERFDVMPRDAIRIGIGVTGDAERAFDVVAGGPASAAIVAAWREQIAAVVGITS